jgi:hypothetical protein
LGRINFDPNLTFAGAANLVTADREVKVHSPAWLKRRLVVVRPLLAPSEEQNNRANDDTEKDN